VARVLVASSSFAKSEDVVGTNSIRLAKKRGPNHASDSLQIALILSFGRGDRGLSLGDIHINDLQ
jgi:hypothetical protein